MAPRAIHCPAAIAAVAANPHFIAIFARSPQSVKPAPITVVRYAMNADQEEDWARAPAPEREMIRIETAQSHAGIAAALRRAFEAAASEPSDHDFAALLARLN